MTKVPGHETEDLKENVERVAQAESCGGMIPDPGFRDLLEMQKLEIARRKAPPRRRRLK